MGGAGGRGGRHLVSRYLPGGRKGRKRDRWGGTSGRLVPLHIKHLSKQGRAGQGRKARRWGGGFKVTQYMSPLLQSAWLRVRQQPDPSPPPTPVPDLGAHSAE